jgi:hypothetical protein
MNLESINHSVTIQRDDSDDGISDFEPFSVSLPLIPSVGDVIETAYGNYRVVSRRIVVSDPGLESCDVLIRCCDV